MSKERRRVSPDEVRANARAGSGGQNWLKLPSEVRTWQPDKAGTFMIDILPYEVKTDKHPDQGIEPGTIWYKFQFAVHHGVGVNNTSIVCPGSLGQKCPICEKKQVLAKDWDKNEEAIKALNPQKFVAYNIKDPDDGDKVAVFAMSKGKFGEVLDTEIDQVADENLLFYEVKDGKTLKTRFSDASYEGRKYIEATRFDFVDREDMDEDETLAKTVCLEEALSVLPYDKIKAMFDGEAEDGAAGGTKTPTKEEDRKAKDKPTAKTQEKPAEKAPKFKKGDWVKNDDDKVGKILDVDGDDIEVECEGKKVTWDVDDIEPTQAPKVKEGKATEPKGKGPGFKVGDTVKDEDDNQGRCEKIDLEDDEVTIKTKTGVIIVDLDEVTLVKAAGEAEPEPLAVGDTVTWDDEDEEGEITKINEAEGWAKVKDKRGGKVKVPMKDLTKK